MTTILATLPDNRILVRRHSDNSTLLGHPLPLATPSTRSLITHSGPFASDLLNHENLISIHSELISVPNFASSETPQARVYLLYDYCDAGSVARLLDDPPCAITQTGFLPESLVWHVTVGVLRALQWMHEGLRDTYCVSPRDKPDTSKWADMGDTHHNKVGGGGRCKRERGIQPPPSTGWTPVFHTEIAAETILFQQPRGIETYGQVKLVGLQRCLVAAHVDVKGGKAPAVGIKRNKPASLEEVKEGRGKWVEGIKEGGVREAQGRVAMENRPFSRGTDLFDLSTVLFHMMTGHPIPGIPGNYNSKGQECTLCGCNHLTFYDDRTYHRPCPHACSRDYNVDAWMSILHDYTPALREVVGKMLRMKRDEEARASEVLEDAWRGFEYWAANTPDGVLYRDVFDDMWFRQHNEARMEKATREIGDEVEDEFMVL